MMMRIFDFVKGVFEIIEPLNFDLTNADDMKILNIQTKIAFTEG